MTASDVEMRLPAILGHSVLKPDQPHVLPETVRPHRCSEARLPSATASDDDTDDECESGRKRYTDLYQTTVVGRGKSTLSDIVLAEIPCEAGIPTYLTAPNPLKGFLSDNANVEHSNVASAACVYGLRGLRSLRAGRRLITPFTNMPSEMNNVSSRDNSSTRPRSFRAHRRPITPLTTTPSEMDDARPSFDSSTRPPSSASSCSESLLSATTSETSPSLADNNAQDNSEGMPMSGLPYRVILTCPSTPYTKRPNGQFSRLAAGYEQP